MDPAAHRDDIFGQRPTRIRVDLDAISHNLQALAAHAGVPVMPIIKANAYGHGLARVGLHLQAQGAGQLGVAFLEEGIALRRAGVTLPILVMGGIFGPQAATVIANDLDVTVSSIDKLRQVEAAAEALGRKATIHLKIDTGMERIGVHSYRAGPFIEAAVASRWCTVKGVYSHLACSDEPDSPMTQSTWPRSSSKETPLTARTVASRETKRTSRSRTVTKGSPLGRAGAARAISGDFISFISPSGIRC